MTPNGTKVADDPFAVSCVPGMDTGGVPPSPVDGDEKTPFIYSLVDHIWDIDTPPLTCTDSRWSAFSTAPMTSAFAA